MTPQTQTDHEVLYAADPMCTWCWGFAPVSLELQKAVEGKAGFRVLAGGLALNPGGPMHAGEVEVMLAEWHRVHAATGQPFDFDHPVDTTTVYDSGPACRALALMQREQPVHGLAYLHALQHAFYVERKDLSRTEALCDAASACGADADAFARRLAEPDAGKAFDDDLWVTENYGLRSFPTVALRLRQRHVLLTVGYRPWKDLAPHVERWLATP
ncbi:MAG TPA: DsbA family protein [Nevskiaceae bacterium]